MKWKKLTCFFVSLFIPYSPSQAESSLLLQNELSSVKVFSLSQNGFIAKKLPPLLIYEKTLKNRHSTNIFKTIIKDTMSTPEGKAYAACGLWETHKADEILLDGKYENLSITVLKGDILRKEKLSEVVSQIKKHGCN